MPLKPQVKPPVRNISLPPRSNSASRVFDILNETLSCFISQKIVFFMLQFLNEVFIRVAFANREKYKSVSSNEDCIAFIPQKLFCCKSLPVHKLCENVDPPNEQNCMFDSKRLQSVKTENSHMLILLRMPLDFMFEKVQC